MSDDFDATARHCWAMAQRVGMQIAELPMKVRERALAGAETCLRAAGSELGVADQQLDSLIDLQMKAIRQIVTDFDVAGRTAAGKRPAEVGSPLNNEEARGGAWEARHKRPLIK